MFIVEWQKSLAYLESIDISNNFHVAFCILMEIHKQEEDDKKKILLIIIFYRRYE